ncbi:MAG: phosphoribosyl-AMP cyclohydrolase [Candidatus Nasuia deltocephalinicola]
MTAFINYNSLIKIIFKWFVNYYSRSKNFFWFKGVKSKNFQIFKKIYIDCDMDIVTIFILQNYNLCCHTNYIYCDFNKLNII